MPLRQSIQKRNAITRLALWVSAMFVATALLGLWLGRVTPFRNVHYAIAAVLLFAVWRRRALFQESIAPVAWRALLAASLVWCLLISLSRWAAFELNGVDFSIFDWMLYSTHSGRLGYSPIYDVNHFGVHSTFLLFLLVPFHAWWPSPLWLVVLGPVCIWAGLFPLRRLSRALLGENGGIELAFALAWLASSWLGHMLNGVFRIEHFIPVLTLWFLVGWMERRPKIWMLALLGMLCAKEDSALAVCCFGLATLAVERDRWKESLTAMAMAALFFVTYAGWLQPLLLGRPAPGYWGFWSDFGESPKEILFNMATSPLRVASKLVTSHWYVFFGPLLFVPFASVRAVAGFFPTFFLLGVANYEQMHEYGGYYASPLVAWALFGVLEVLSRLGKSSVLSGLALTGVLLFPLAWGGYGRTTVVSVERLHDMVSAERALLEEKASQRCVQTVLWPHMSYLDMTPLFELDCTATPGAVALIHPALDTYPFPREKFSNWVRQATDEGRVKALPSGFLLLRAPKASATPVP